MRESKHDKKPKSMGKRHRRHLNFTASPKRRGALTVCQPHFEFARFQLLQELARALLA